MTLIIDMPVNSTSYADAIKIVLDWSARRESRYVCVANVHLLMEAHDSAEYNRVVCDADLVTPDGMPLVWMMRLKGQSEQQRVYGPTLMLHILESAARQHVAVGFYGSTSDVLQSLNANMQTRFPELKVDYLFSPPFQETSWEEDQKIVKQINASSVTILFVGLGCPKQEKWMAAHRGRINAVMIGVGAAFDFHAGFKPQAPPWLQTAGMEWLYRLATEPRRLWKRYLYHNPRFIILALLDLLAYAIKRNE
jgi:N-acetylglucosaminyldiphosphoundecaprenol N-acetyl-beta-D-mannosaminyltransferase